MSEPNVLFACGSAGVRQTIKPFAWTRVQWPYVPLNTTPFVLHRNTIEWQCPVSAEGLWYVDALVAWDNSKSMGPHVRSIRIVQAAGMWEIPVVTDDKPYGFMGDSPHAKRPFHCPTYLQMGLTNAPSTFWVEVMHTNPVAQDLVPVGMEAPLLMAAKK